GWYNGHPDHQDAPVDLGGDRVVVVGNGNVALDVARVLTADPEMLATTDIADLPLATLRGSRVSEVVVLGRRGPSEAAFTMPELIGLAGLSDIDVVVETGGAELDRTTPKGRLLAELAARPLRDGSKRIVLRFCTAPVRILGEEAVTGLVVEKTRLEVVDGRTVAIPTGETEVLAAQMVLRSVGYRGTALPGLPFDDATGTVPNEAGRVRPGVYVAGWIKRGPTGFIGTNKSCSEETVASFLDDLAAGVLPATAGSRAELDAWLDATLPASLDLDDWRAIDAAERSRGTVLGRPRVKVLDPGEMLQIARAARGASRRSGWGALRLGL
ncbi:MAG TPA: 4Fe-4S ferredoxin, partial [Marmoricola sp.]|nr:4Fe-4S ferredoxin [Marmoricola sp.]